MKKFFRFLLMVIVAIAIAVLYYFNYIPHPKYSNKSFGIEGYITSSDLDNDGIDDLTDTLMGAKEYVATKPQYKSIYYATGYPDDNHGVCTDVVAFGLLNAGYNLMDMVYYDIWDCREAYPWVDVVDINIDFRRVENLAVFFERNYVGLTKDIYEIDKWQGGDIVIFSGHIGIVSDDRNYKGVPFLIHNGHPYQLTYNQDFLEHYKDDVIGHYRICDEYKK